MSRRVNPRGGRRWVALASALLAALPGAVRGQEGAPEPPSQEVPAFVPVLLVPGWFDTGVDLAALGARLRSAGWPADHVVAVTFADATGSNRDHAVEIAFAVDSLLARTGASRVDIVAHSMGGLSTRLYLRQHPEGARRVVFIASPHRGTWTAYLAFGDARAEMMPGSGFLAELNEGPPVPPGVEALTVRTLLDTHILPGSSATLPGIPDFVVCCETHQSVKWDGEAFGAVNAFLRRGVVP